MFGKYIDRWIYIYNIYIYISDDIILIYKYIDMLIWIDSWWVDMLIYAGVMSQRFGAGGIYIPYEQLGAVKGATNWISQPMDRNRISKKLTYLNMIYVSRYMNMLVDMVHVRWHML